MEKLGKLPGGILDLGTLNTTKDKFKGIQLQLLKALAVTSSSKREITYAIKLKLSRTHLNQISKAKTVVKSLPFIHESHLDRAALLWMSLQGHITTLVVRGNKAFQNATCPLEMLSLLIFLLPQNHEVISHDISKRKMEHSLFAFITKPLPLQLVLLRIYR